MDMGIVCIVSAGEGLCGLTGVPGNDCALGLATPRLGSASIVGANGPPG